MNLSNITMPTVAGMRASIDQAISTIREYSVTLRLPNLSRNVPVEPITHDADLAPEANRVRTIFGGSVLKGFTTAVTTLLVGVIALGGVAALIANPVGIGILALTVALFALGTTLNISHTPPPPPVEEVVEEPAPLTTIQYLASLVGLGRLVGVEA